MLSIPIKQTIKSAWSVAWTHKLLWLLGLFITSGAFFLDYLIEDCTELTTFRNTVLVKLNVTLNDWRAFLVLFITFVLLSLILLIAIFAKTSLVAALGKLKSGDKLKIGELLKIGWQNFGKVVLFELIFGVINLILFALVVLFIPSGGLMALFVILLILYNVWLFLFRHYVYCYAVIEGKSAINSIVAGWKLYIANYIDLTVIKITEVGLWVVASFVLILSLILIALPFILLGVIGMLAVGQMALMVVTWLGYIVLGTAFLLIKGGIQVFFLSYLTNAYWKFK